MTACSWEVQTKSPSGTWAEWRSGCATRLAKSKQPLSHSARVAGPEWRGSSHAKGSCFHVFYIVLSILLIVSNCLLSLSSLSICLCLSAGLVRAHNHEQGPCWNRKKGDPLPKEVHLVIPWKMTRSLWGSGSCETEQTYREQFMFFWSQNRSWNGSHFGFPGCNPSTQIHIIQRNMSTMSSRLNHQSHLNKNDQMLIHFSKTTFLQEV